MGQFLAWEIRWDRWGEEIRAGAFLPPKILPPLLCSPALPSFLLLQRIPSCILPSPAGNPFPVSCTPQSFPLPRVTQCSPCPALGSLKPLPALTFLGNTHRISCASSTHFQCSTGCSFSCSTVSSCCRPAFSAGPPERNKFQSPARQEAEWEGEEKPWSLETPRELHSLHH